MKPIAVTRFTTDAFAPADRHAAWEQRDWPAIGPLFDTAPIGQFHNHSERFALGAITVHVSAMGAQHYHRSAARARADGVDSLIVELLLAGETRGDAAGRALANAPGCMMFDDLAQEHSHATTDTQTVMLAIPRALAVRNRIDPTTLHGRRVSADAAALLRAHLLAVHALLPRLDAAQGARLGQVALDLIGVALDVDGQRAPAAGLDARNTALAMAARRLIEGHLHLPVLSADWLCGRLGVSRSKLYRMFEEHGGVQAYVREQRLEAVRAVLATVGRVERIAELADAWGFSDAAHLTRAFRQRFGLSPNDYRALHGGQ